MKRILISILLGVALPIGYTVAVGFVSDYYPNIIGDTIQVYGRPAPAYAFAPTLFGVYVSNWLAANNFFGHIVLLDSIAFRASFILIPFLLYSSIAWLVLRWTGLPRPKLRLGKTDPPDPPKS